MLKILIVGYGFVGKSLAELFVECDPSRDSFRINIHDPAKGFNADIESQEYDFAFVCIPTPNSADGYCDDLAVSTICQDFVESRNFKTVVIKSTISAGAAARLGELSESVVIWPEFLRERFASQDILRPPVCVVGTRSAGQFSRIESLIRRLGIRPSSNQIRQVKPEIASLFKLVSNSFLSMKVVFVHQLHLWMLTNGLFTSTDIDTMAQLMSEDPRVGNSHNMSPGHHGYGYSGSCLPKDTNALFTESGKFLSLLGDVIERNEILRNPSLQTS